MLSLFSAAGQRRLDEIVKPGMLCVFDFDGTLAPIVPQPERARLPLAVRRRMVELCGLTTVAVITGRSLEDIRPRLNFDPAYLVGNHGLEGVPGWEARRDTYEAMCQSWLGTLQSALGDSTRSDAGIVVEDKRYSLSVHYRLARDQRQAEERLMALFATLSPPARVIAGKCVFSLVPPEAVDKGQALEQLMAISRARSAIYVGDDVTDEDVFVLQRQDLMSIRVGLDTESAAGYYLAQPGEIVLLIDDIIRRLKHSPQT